MSPELLTIGILTIINSIALVLVARDKHLSRAGRPQERIPEGIFFLMAAMFGGVGVYLGMITLRHKTRKWYFQIGIPLIILQNIATLYVFKNLLWLS